jgi:hypothetical protein
MEKLRDALDDLDRVQGFMQEPALSADPTFRRGLMYWIQRMLKACAGLALDRDDDAESELRARTMTLCDMWQLATMNQDRVALGRSPAYAEHPARELSTSGVSGCSCTIS